MKRRKFLAAISALPFLGFLKPDTEPTSVPGLERIVVEAGGVLGADGPRVIYGETEPILNIWVSDSPRVTELLWAWKDGDTKRLAYASVVSPEYAKKYNNGVLLSDSLEFHKFEA